MFRNCETGWTYSLIFEKNVVIVSHLCKLIPFLLSYTWLSLFSMLFFELRRLKGIRWGFVLLRCCKLHEHYAASLSINTFSRCVFNFEPKHSLAMIHWWGAILVIVAEHMRVAIHPKVSIVFRCLISPNWRTASRWMALVTGLLRVQKHLLRGWVEVPLLESYKYFSRWISFWEFALSGALSPSTSGCSLIRWWHAIRPKIL